MLIMKRTIQDFTKKKKRKEKRNAHRHISVKPDDSYTYILSFTIRTSTFYIY